MELEVMAQSKLGLYHENHIPEQLRYFSRLSVQLDLISRCFIGNLHADHDQRIGTAYEKPLQRAGNGQHTDNHTTSFVIDLGY